MNIISFRLARRNVNMHLVSFRLARPKMRAAWWNKNEKHGGRRFGGRRNGDQHLLAQGNMDDLHITTKFNELWNFGKIFNMSKV